MPSPRRISREESRQHLHADRARGFDDRRRDFAGDIVLVEKGPRPAQNDIVVACVDDE
jgi:hypothetical protein